MGCEPPDDALAWHAMCASLSVLAADRVPVPNSATSRLGALGLGDRTSLGLSFRICTMGTIKAPVSEGWR